MWRVTNHRTLDGGGGLRASGRWHTRGQRIVYCAPDPATALLETLVHAQIDIEDMPLQLNYIEIHVPDSIPLSEIKLRSPGRSWRTRVDETREIGDRWLRGGRTPLLRVPSVLAPATWNTLINPVHPASRKIRIARVHEQAIDRRLAK